MTNIKRFLFATVLTTTLFTCEKVPDYCSSGEVYDPTCQFCFGGAAHNMCGGKKYNPLTESCAQNAVGTRCQDETAVPLGAPCGGYALSTASAPASGGDVTRTPDKPNYAANERVVLNADPKQGYEFVGWAGASTSTSRTVTITMNDNAPLVAMFKPLDPPGAAAHTLITTAFPNYGGTVARNPNAATYNTGTAVTLTATAASGYTFSGWSGTEAPTSASSPTATVRMDKSKTLVAMFTPVARTLTVNANPAEGGAVFVNGTALKDAARQNVGPDIVAWAMAADGYVFEKWSMAGTTVGTDNPATINITNSNMTLTANFRPGGDGRPAAPPPVICTLTTNVSPQGGGSVSRNPDGKTYRIGTRVTATATPTAGYTFTRWSGAHNSTDAADTAVTIMMDGNKALTAGFQRQGTTPPPIDTAKYAVIVSSAGTGATGSGSYAEGATVNIKAGTAPPGWEFKRWTSADGVIFNNAESASTWFTMPANTVTVAAEFEWQSGGDSSSTPQYLVAVSSAGTGATGGSGYEAGAIVTITAGTASIGQQFKNWTSESNGVDFADYRKDTTTFTMPANAVTVTAVFEAIKYKVTVSSAGTGAIGDGDYVYGAPVTITAGTAPDGQRFKNWTTTSSGVVFGNPRDESTWFTMPTNAVTVTAVFETVYTVTVSAGTGATGDGNYAVGDTVRIAAGTPPSGQQFKNWTTADGVTFANANSASTWFIMPTKSVTVTAEFEAIPPGTYAVTVLAGAGAIGGGSYAAGATVNISAGTAPTGQQFKNWTTTSESVIFADANSAATTFIMPASAVTVTANFEPQVIIPPNEDDTFVDGRDNHVYKKVVIEGQTWMAENLNYETASGSWCYGEAGAEYVIDGSGDGEYRTLSPSEIQANCNKYGRLYDWGTAMAGLASSNANPSGRRGVCPEGWHLPSRIEWGILAIAAGGTGDYGASGGTAGTALKAENGWDDYQGKSGNGTDDLGFSAMPGGLRGTGYGSIFDGIFVGAGSGGHWWTATEHQRNYDAYFRATGHDQTHFGESNYPNDSGFSVRCVQDN